MWFIIEHNEQENVYLNTNYIVNFNYNNPNTIIHLVDGRALYVRGDVTQKIMEVLRMSGAGIKKIKGE